MALYTNIKGPINYTTVGSPTIENGIVSDLSYSDYVKTTTETIITSNSNIELYARFKLDNLDTGFKAIFNIGSVWSSPILSVYGNYVTGYSGDIYEYRLSIDTWYRAKLVGKNGIWTGYVYDDNENLLYSKSKENSFTDRNGIVFIGAAYGSASPTIGSIDLNETYININGNAWFGTSFSKVKLYSQSAITYTKVGNVSITDDGIATGFTDKTDYLTLPAFNPGTAKWKFTTKVKIYDMASQISLIDRNSSTRCFQIVVRTTKKFRVNISTNGSSKANEVDGTHVLSTNTIYYISFEYDGSKYYLKYSTDNINWTTDITINNSTKIYPVSTMCMGHSWYNSGTEKWNGEIYLRYTRFEIDGVTNDKYKLHCLEGN